MQIMLFLCIALMLIRTGGHFVCACVHPKNDNSVGASNMMAGNRELPLSYSPLKAISLVPYFPTKNVLHDKNRTFSMRVFSCRFFSIRFSWPFQDLKDWAPKTTVPVSDLSFTGKAIMECISMVWFPNSWFYLSRKKCIVAMFSCFKKSEKKFTTRGLFITRCLMLNWSRRHAFMYATKTWNLWGFFTVFRNFFCGKMYKNYSTGKKKWIESEIETIFPLQLVIHVVQNRQAGEQKPHWDKTNKTYNFKWRFSLLGCVQTDATTPNMVAPVMLGVVAYVLAVVCKQMQQLPTMLGPAVHCGKDTTRKSL